MRHRSFATMGAVQALIAIGLLASVAGLFLTCITYSGEASAANGSTYTLYSIAAVVLGGVSLFGGSGSAIGIKPGGGVVIGDEVMTTEGAAVAVIGGVVYRGNRITQLYGAYVFSDNGSGNVWSLRYDGSNTIPFQVITTAAGLATSAGSLRQFAGNSVCKPRTFGMSLMAM